MYKGFYFRENRRRRRRKGIIAGLLTITASIGGIFLFIVLQVMAAPGNVTAEITEEVIVLPEEEEANESIFEEVERNPGIPVIIIDAGHGGEDEGCSGGNVLEKDINLQIAQILQKKLTDMGYQVIMTREDDTYIEIEKRAEMANFYQADIYVSIHQNSYEGLGPSGIETWYYGKDISRDSKRLAQLIHRETLSSTGAVERELRDDADFCVTGKTTMPACLIETGFLSNPAERDLLIMEEYQEKIAAGIAAGIELYVHPKIMYLTFDDGPTAENTCAILDILKERNIKATFFVIGESVRKYPEAARRIVAEGHTIGIHCNRHEYKTLYQSVDSYMQDFEDAYNAVLEVTGVETKIFRFPGGSINAYNKKVSEAIVLEMTEKGFIYYDWNASLEDAVKDPDPEQLITNATESTLGRKKVILLAHDTVDETVSCLEELLDRFPEYQMEALTPDVDPVQFR